MEPIRLTFWNIPKWAEVLQYIGGALACLIFAYGLYRHVGKWRLGKSERLQWSLADRFKALVQYGFLQGRLGVDPPALGMHLAIFWGMVILAIGTALATVDWDVTHLFFGFQFLKGELYLVYELILDLFGVFLIAGLGIAIYRRYAQRPARLETPYAPTFGLDSFYLLSMLLGIVLTGYVVEALRLEIQKPPWADWSIVGRGLSYIFAPLSIDTQKTLHVFFWCLHAVLAFTFIASIPFTKAFHMVSSAVSIFLRKTAAPGALSAGDAAGVERIGDFTWRQLVQFDGCTWCGRCQEACPANGSGLPLSPKNLVLKLETQLLHATKVNGNGHASPELHGSVITAGELWACTTCQACEAICPVFIEHPRAVVDLRRHLVNQGEVEKGPQDALMKLGRYGNSFGQSDRARAKWSQALEIKVKDARKEAVEYLWFVGDYASYDPRVQNVTRLTARIFQQAGLDFGILSEGERNAGNDVRRLGEEGLFEMLRDKNLQAIAKAKSTMIVTTDPHSYNTLKNEYPLDSGIRGVLHYTELLDQLSSQGKLPFKKRLSVCGTYHDPCYLGRYNGVYEPPRRLLSALGVRLIEMPRNRSHSYCCGAGGGRIWMEDPPGAGERPALSRIKEAIALEGVQLFIVACPKDYAMFQDAVKTTGNEGKIQVKDVAELVGEAMAL
ncbi:MAG: heterodisulfide reductase-related iron-sulfur binding cluster [Candidatus Omnitrophica bacterium]|nr:heterodisulfide reductase-related iron-sulfur binding cluster [Candidatus Omnitrophota bacterium]